ncbi:Uncharacterised protein [Bordetella pertussis]|nr:Uncharacterised protein [Bordetella pertussis]CFW36551.1 Uncharacterised protein [Bordetella pertussis]
MTSQAATIVHRPWAAPSMPSPRANNRLVPARTIRPPWRSIASPVHGPINADATRAAENAA